MKKTALLIAVLSLAVATMADNQMKVVHSHSMVASHAFLAESTQKVRGDELTEEFHQTYPLTAAGRVSIANINGDVRITAWDRNEVKVDALKRAYSQERLSEVTVEVTNTADSVMIKTRYRIETRISEPATGKIIQPVSNTL